MTTASELDDDFRRYSLFVGGQWVKSESPETFMRVNPANTDQRVAESERGSAADVAYAIDVARHVFDKTEWPRSPAKERSQILNTAARLLRENKVDLAKRVTLELGKPVRHSQTEVAVAADVLEYYGALVMGLRGEAITQHVEDAVGLVVQEPVGVVGMITPWNFPVALAAWKLGPAIAAGCTSVLKPAEVTSGVTLEFASILAGGGLPAGVVNVVTGPGSVVGEALAASEKVDKISFTGSTEVGRSISRAAASNLKRVSLELGGKSSNIVFPDADLKAAARGAFWAVYLNSGQTCQAGSRLLVHESIYEDLLQDLVELVGNCRVGDPLDTKTLYGPLVDESQLATVLGYIEAGVGEGAGLACGGHRMTDNDLNRGYYVEPTVFSDVEPWMRIAREEIFGPVLAVMPFDTPNEAVQLANDTMYGLAAGVWTSDMATALSLSRGIRAGTVWVNSYHDAGLYPAMPFGGYKQSGVGRELGREGMDEYLETKSVHLKVVA